MTDDEARATERRRPGRPPKDKKKAAIGARIAPELRDSVLTIAERHGRSFSQQLELLLELAVRNEREGLYDRIANIEAELAELRSTIESGRRDLAMRIAHVVHRLQPVLTKIYAAADPTPAAQHRPARLYEVGEPGEPARLLPVEISVERRDDGSVVLRDHYEGQVIHETPLDAETARRIVNELLAEETESLPPAEPKRRRRAAR
jgi:hypothetical protein